MVLRVLRDISCYFNQYAFDALIVGTLGMLLYGCIFFYSDSKNAFVWKNLKNYIYKMISQYISSFLLSAYLYIMASIALLSRREKYIDKIDFSFWGAGLSTQMNRAFFVENIIMFVPLGVLFPLCFKKADNPILMLIVGFGGSLLIETIQFVAKWGRFEIVDLWTNTLGAILGWLLYRIVYHIFKAVTKSHLTES